MALLGRTNQLKLNRFVDFGAYLDGGGEDDEILLPTRSVPRGAEIGDTIEAFVYRDSEDRLIATTEKPYAEVGDCAFLKVKEVNSFGAFLDWGLEKDLFVPFGEQRWEMKVGQRYVVVIYVDNTDRLAATSKLRKLIPSTSNEFVPRQEVNLLISNRTDLGYEAVIDGKALGMVFESDALVPLKAGMRTRGFIKNVRPDGKIDLSLQPIESPKARDELETRILDSLREAGGASSLTDKSAPEEIFAAYGVSKRAYKQALGRLYKDRLITLKPGRVELAP